jgi:hypothetical protein
MLNAFTTGAVLGLLLNLVAILFNRKLALKFIPWLILYLLIAGSYEILTIDAVWGVAMEISRKYSNWITYPLVILITGGLGGLYWKFVNDAAIKIEAKIDKSSAEPGVSAQGKGGPLNQFSPEAIAKALKKELRSEIKSSQTPKYPPSVSKAKKETHISSIDQFSPTFSDKLKPATEFPGYFLLSADPSPTNVYSSLMVKTKNKFGTHYYASISMGAVENVLTMDFMGDISVCISPQWDAFFIWESEQSQKGWLPIRIKASKHPLINTLGVYQKGRNVSVYINNEFVGEFIKLKDAASDSVGVHIKANRETGGKMIFQSFAIWEY